MESRREFIMTKEAALAQRKTLSAEASNMYTPPSRPNLTRRWFEVRVITSTSIISDLFELALTDSMYEYHRKASTFQLYGVTVVFAARKM